MPVRFLLRVVILGLTGGAAVSLLAFLLARYGPSGGSWSFRGNGALAAYAVVPGLLAGGWTAVVLHHRGADWLGRGIVAGGIGLALAAVDAALLPVFGTSVDQSVGAVLLLPVAAWAVISPILAVFAPTGEATRRTPLTLAIGGAGAWLVSVSAGVGALGIVLPAGS